MSQSSTSLSAEAGKALESLQEFGSSPLVLPEHYVNPSIQVMSLITSELGQQISSGYTCQVYLPAQPCYSPFSEVQRIDVSRGPATFPLLLEDREHYVIRTAQAGFSAEINREIIRAARMPEVVVLQTILAWDPQHLRVLMPRHYPVPVSALTTRHVFRLMQDMRRAISLLHDHDIIHADVRLANIMIRTDPASFVLIDYGGSKETIWPVRYGYTVAGRGGTQHRPPAECMNEWSTPSLRVPYLCGRSDFHRLACTIREEILGQMASEAEQELDMMLDTTTWKVKPNPHSLFPPGSWRDTAVNPTIMLTAHLWTAEGKSRTCTTTFRSPLERKGNSNGHFVDEPDQPSYEPGVSLTAQINTGSWEHRVFPWLSYRNRDGMLELEPPRPTSDGPSPSADPEQRSPISGQRPRAARAGANNFGLSSAHNDASLPHADGSSRSSMLWSNTLAPRYPEQMAFPERLSPIPSLSLYLEYQVSSISFFQATPAYCEQRLLGREVLNEAPPFLALADSTFQGLLRQGASLLRSYPGRPSILGALAAGDSLQPRDSLPAPILANEGFLNFLRDKLDEPVKCATSQAVCYVERARHDFNLKDHEFAWQIMDLHQPPDLDLYGQDPTHFQQSAELPAIGHHSELKEAPETPQGNAPQTPVTSPFAGGLGHGDTQQTPHTPPPFLPVFLCCSWNATQGMIHQEMLATHALIRASTLRELLIVAASQANFPIEKTYHLTVPAGRTPFGQFPIPQRLVQTFIHDDMVGPKEMAEAKFRTFRREFFNDEACAEVIRSVTGGAGQRLLSKLKSNAHRADVFRYVEHWLRGGIYLDIKTAFLITPQELHSSIVAEWRQQPLLSDLASQAYGWDADTLRASGPPDYFLTAIGQKKDHIFQGILLGRRQHPLMTAALRHAFQHKYVDAQGAINETYLFFCIALYEIVRQDLLNDQALHPTAQGRSLAPGWHLTQTLGPIYLLQEIHENELRRMQGVPLNEGHGFRTATGQLIALTRCWGWNKGWKADPASTKANNDAILRGLPTALHAAQEAGNATAQRGNASSTPVPTEATIQAHVLEALDTSLLDRIVQLIEKWPRYYGELTKQQVQELIPRAALHGITLGRRPTPELLLGAQARLLRRLPPRILETRGPTSLPPRRHTSHRDRPSLMHRIVMKLLLKSQKTLLPQWRNFVAKDFYDWVVAVADLQSLTAPEVVGVLQPQEFTAIWNARLQVLTKLPTVLAGLSRVYQKPEADRKDLSWRSVISGRLVVHPSGHLTMATKDRAGQEHIHPKLTTWLGGLQATIKNGVPYALFEGKRVATQDEFRLFATTLQTIYEAATKKAHQPSHVNIIQATRDSHPTIKITHGQVLDSKLNVIRNVTGQQLRSRRERQAEHRENKESRRSDPYGSHEPSSGQHSRSAGSQDWQDWQDWDENSYAAKNSAYHGYYR
ncbi:unnamed protein product [Symbiodinium sp. CCMP2592]|nr:unnamed protein product [Symbiodinium sp. CCMP2592]